MEDSPFNGLSAELRNAIYELTFRAASLLDLSACLRGKGSFQHQLTQTCNQIRQESLLLFYSSTDFELDEPHSASSYFEEVPEAIEATMWLFGINPAHVATMRSFGFRKEKKIMSVSRYHEFVAEEAQKSHTVGMGERMAGNFRTVCSNGTGTLVKAYRKVPFHDVHLIAHLVDVTAEDRDDYGYDRHVSKRADMQWRTCGFVVLKDDNTVEDLGGMTATNEKSDERSWCRLCIRHSRRFCPITADTDAEDPYYPLSPTDETSHQMPFYATEGLLDPDETDMGSEEALEDDGDTEDDWEEASDANNDDDMSSEDELREGDLGAGSEK